MKKYINWFALISLIFNGAASAIPPTNPYDFGETLSPTCLPGGVNCSVIKAQKENQSLIDISDITTDHGDILYFNGTNWTDLGPGTTGQFLKTFGSNANPAWSSIESGAGNIIEEGNSSIEIIDTGTDGHLIFSSEGSESARIIANGNIGIGTITPDADLNLVGDMHFDGVPYFGPTLPNNAPLSQLAARSATTTPFNTYPSLSNIEWLHDSPSGYLFHLTQGENMGSGAALIGLGVDEGGRGLYVNNKKTGQGIVVTQNSTITSPMAYGVLINAGNGAAPGFLLQQNSTDGKNTTGAIFEAYSGVDGEKLVEFKSPGGHSAGYVHSVNGDLTWNSNVGIGTDNPQSLLEVQGPLGIGAASAGILTLATQDPTIYDGDQLGRINFNAPLESSGGDAILASASIWAEADNAFSNTLNSTELVFATANSEEAIERMRVDSSGFVGIGTATPSRKLHVYNAAAGAIGVFETDGAYVSFQLQTSSSNVDIMSVAGNFVVQAGEAERIRVLKTGQMGIGTATPSEKLQVDGNIAPVTSGQDLGTPSLKWDFNLAKGSVDEMTVTDLFNAPSSSAAPVNPQGGTIYYDTDDNKLKVYNGSIWEDLN